MISRYLGNKNVILDEILEAVGERAEPGDLVCDVFSGSLSVSYGLKRSGYRVAANDVNLFSSVLGRAFILNDQIPPVPVADLLGSKGDRLRKAATSGLSSYEGREGYAYLDDPRYREAAADLLALLLYLDESPGNEGLDPEFARTDFFDHYCEEGGKSAFTSSRGREGRRRFFSSANARHIDGILNRVRQWRSEGLLEPPLEAMILSIALRAIERVSNTQGTYHDFPRDRYDPRALRPLRLELPPLDGLLETGVEHLIGTESDSLEFISEVPEHPVLYLDPPYNFRQYTAYYFLPNVICRYPTLDDPEEYFSGLRYVRGQNPDDDFVSSFCKPRQFLPSLRTLIERAKTQTVVLSYFDGRNHWNDFKAEANAGGIDRLEEFFEDDLFVPGSLQIRPVSRQNYQSYGGFKARNVSEYLFIAAKA
ncbi:MAG: adenine-specific DNA-methyltransferase [Solirubrobacterales bacterium]|jgi:adenine-specific DNA methylase|nr:adenine-specific DNA-methyltransferase [Solirubrobacterales bacterium]